MSNWLELIIAIVIVTGIAIAIWRTGQANPVSTGRLGARLGRVEKDVGAVQADVHSISKRVDAVERHVAVLTAKIEQLPTRADLDNLRELMARDAAMAEKTWAAVERIEGFFIEQGVRRK